MYVAWVHLILWAILALGLVAGIVVASRRIAALRAEDHPTGGWSALRVAAIALAVIAVFFIWRATGPRGAHQPLDKGTIDDLGSSYFDEHYYAHGTVNKDGFDEWQRFVNPDYDHAKSTVDDRSSGTYCIKVTRQYGGQYGEDGHSTGYRPTGVEKKRVCIPEIWNSDTGHFEATESDPTE